MLDSCGLLMNFDTYAFSSSDDMTSIRSSFLAGCKRYLLSLAGML